MVSDLFVLTLQLFFSFFFELFCFVLFFCSFPFFCSLTKGITPKICRVCVCVQINKRSLNLLCVWNFFVMFFFFSFRFFCLSFLFFFNYHLSPSFFRACNYFLFSLHPVSMKYCVKATFLPCQFWYVFVSDAQKNCKFCCRLLIALSRIKTRLDQQCSIGLWPSHWTLKCITLKCQESSATLCS